MNAFWIIFGGMVATMITRFAPFILLSGKHGEHPLVVYLGKVLPASAISLLVVYVYKNVSFTTSSGYLPELIATSIVVVLQLKFKNSLVSMLLGTVSYMLLVQYIF